MMIRHQHIYSFQSFQTQKGRLNYYQCKRFKIRINNFYGMEVSKYLPLL